MNRRSLITGGWLAMFSAFSAIPLAYLTIKLEESSEPLLILLLSGLQLFGTILFVLLNMYLKKLLNTRFNFFDTNRPIDAMIIAGGISGFLVILALTFPQTKEYLNAVIVVIVIFQGIIQVQFGYKLLKLDDNLGGLLRPFCYTTITTGVCIASIVLIIVGVVVSAIADLMMGTIFFQVAGQMRESDAKNK